MKNYQKVKRFEVIDKYGRSYTNYNIDNVKFSLQDNGKTLKVFLSNDYKSEVECDI